MKQVQQTAKWRKRAILFLVSQGVTLFGSSLVQFAMVWYVTLKTGSGGWVSALSICSFAPQFLISFVSGTWADRYDRRALIVAADAGIALATLALVLLMPRLGEDTALLTALLVVSALRSLGAGVQLPAVNAVIPQLVPPEQLMRFNGLNATLQSIVQFAAPAAAGAVLTMGTLRASLLIDIGTAAVGIGLLGCIAVPKPARDGAEASATVLEDIRQGLCYALSERAVGKLLLLYGAFIFLAVPAGFLATLFVSRTYGDSYLYLTVTELVGFAGMTAGGLLIGVWGGFKDRWKTLYAGLALFGLLAVGMGAARSFILYLILMLVLGVGLTMAQTAVTTLLQELPAPEMQGRVFGLWGAMYSGCLPVGMAVFGPLADLLPMRLLMIVTGGILLALAAVMARLPATEKAA